MSAQPSPCKSDRVQIAELAVGDRFFLSGQCWTISYRSDNGSRVEARESQFSTVRSFFDPLTADKAGEWPTTMDVEVAP